MYLVYTASVKYISSIHVYEKQKFKRLSKMSQLHRFNLPEIKTSELWPSACTCMCLSFAY